MRTADSPRMESSQIRAIIQSLYLETDVAPPSLAHPMAPLGPLMDRLPLRREEVVDLTSQKVLLGLMNRRALDKVATFGVATTDPLAGFFYACGAFAWIFVSASDLTVRKRFSAAHELGHFLLHFRPQIIYGIAVMEQQELPGWRDEFTAEQISAAEEGKTKVSKNIEPSFLRQEREANAFAAELLMPENVVRSLAQSYKNLMEYKDLTGRLAETMLVSHQAMTIRLQSLGLGGATWA